MQGGAVASEQPRTINIEKSSFIGNEAGSGGALYVPPFSQTSLISDIFRKNSAIDGGAVYNDGTTSIVESVFKENFAENGVSCFRRAIQK